MTELSSLYQAILKSTRKSNHDKVLQLLKNCHHTMTFLTKSARFFHLNNSKVPNKIFRTLSTEERSFKEIKIPVPWGHIAGKWWGPYHNRPILTLHGWQDNCGSFDRLIPLLSKNVGFLAVDLPGHGHSTRLPHGMYYHPMNIPILIQQLLEYLRWPRVALMGHSLGAISCFTYTMLFGDTVDYLICIDGLKPLQILTNSAAMTRSVEELFKYMNLEQNSSEPPSYTMDELKRMVCASQDGSINMDQCHHMLTRSIAPSRIHPDKYYFTRDPRLKSTLIVNWPQEDILEGAERVTCPIILTKFTKSGYFEKKQNSLDVLEVVKKASPNSQVHYVDGKHHEHLNNPHVITDLLNNFIVKHDRRDANLGVTVDDISVR